MTPIHPCGMVMDYARHCYEGKMRVWQDSEETIDVIWLRAEPDARIFPGRTVFSSFATWGKGEPKPIVGEVSAGTYYRGMNPWGYLGTDFCGSLEAFARGGIIGVDPPLPLNPDGSCADCERAFVAAGGECGGGSADFIISVHMQGHGGARGGGAAAQGVAKNQVGSGGARGGGVAAQRQIVRQLGAGGARGGGIAWQGAGPLQLGAGGARGGGIAWQGAGPLQLGAGGARGGGEAVQAVQLLQQGQGGALGGGEATQAVQLLQQGQGGALGGGEATQVELWLQEGTGGALGGGEAEQGGSGGDVSGGPTCATALDIALGFDHMISWNPTAQPETWFKLSTGPGGSIWVHTISGSSAFDMWFANSCSEPPTDAGHSPAGGAERVMGGSYPASFTQWFRFNNGSGTAGDFRLFVSNSP